MNTKKIAEKLGIDETVVYGILRFMATAGVIQISKAEKEPGKRGKPSITYQLDSEAVDKLSEFLKTKLL